VACDFFTVETAWLRTLYVFSSLSRWKPPGGVGEVTASPDAGRVAQQGRNLLLTLPEGAAPRFPVRDRDAKYGGACDEVFRAEGTRVIRTPVRPRACGSRSWSKSAGGYSR